MTATRITTELGHSIPPEGPHTITYHLPGWDNAIAFRNGDQALFQRLVSAYPRLTPFGFVKELATVLHQKLGFSSAYGCLSFLHPAAFSMAQTFAFSDLRKPPHKLEPAELLFRIVDVCRVRLYCVGFPLAKRPGIIGVWQSPGVGISSRLAAHLLKQGDEIDVVPFDAAGGDDVTAATLPPPTYLPQTIAHEQVRQHILSLLNRAPVSCHETLKSEDIYLYPTGMAAIYRTHHAIMRVHQGPVVALGAMFDATFQLFHEAPDGFKHFGPCDARSDVMEELEAYVKTQKVVSYVFVEFPSNPLLISVDLMRLRELADQYSFIVVVDDTIGSFCNIDVLPAADIIITSLTKSFSGYANVMGGSSILNPSSSFYSALKDIHRDTFHNEYFAGDAEQLLANSADYLARSTILNRNAKALADYLQTRIRTESAITKVLYPSVSDTAPNYEAFMRPPTESFVPGYGCLLSIDFASFDAARAFYDGLDVHKGPHLGAPLTLAMNFNDWVLGKDEEAFWYHMGYGMRREQVRIAVGLEEVGELVGVVEAALRAADEKMGR
ncbi:putative cystathionine gamma-synthase protein [Favolaschia claudopus]|uniref:Cystathionine gamma-synthase protein n=1 Tax=Favolaschia claudopus TaxID=2862362 RepID=A0AAW0CHS4_9AGAR